MPPIVIGAQLWTEIPPVPEIQTQGVGLPSFLTRIAKKQDRSPAYTWEYEVVCWNLS